MIDLSTVPHHPCIEEIVDVICTRTQNLDRGLFRIEVAYFLAKMAANMRAKVKTKDRGEIPVNVYALGLAVSGSGKGHSIGIIENMFMKGFKERFIQETFPQIASQNMTNLACAKAVKMGTNDAEEYEKLEREFKQAGPLAFTFDSGTTPALKQLRNKLLLANSGSINLQIDEIGSNLLGSIELLTAFLELYDQGEIKNKLTKHTNDNQRGEEIDGKTPTNALLFGTPSKLLDGGSTEEQFYSMLDTGYARRCLFGLGQRIRAGENLTPEQIYFNKIQPANEAIVQKWFTHFVNLADPSKHNLSIELPDGVAIELVRYQIECERLADAMSEYEEIRKSEMTHRYFKALKLAGAFAFIDESPVIEFSHLYSAIKLVEDSGVAFDKILNREKPWVKLAKFIASSRTELTHADLTEKLSFYKNSSRRELMDLATGWGYRNHIIIKKTFMDNIEFFSGETLEETKLDSLIVSYSNHFADGYLGERITWDNVNQLVGIKGYNWCNHHFQNQHRNEENVLVGFNLVVLDVDEGTPLHTAHDLLKEFTFMTYTTKRHTDLENRYRIILPINYRLAMTAEEYKEFYQCLLTWLPFKVDEKANQRSRKWLCHENTTVHRNEGDLLDALQFIPKTSKNDKYNQKYEELRSLDNLERWFANRISQGNRNNYLAQYALALYSTGHTFEQIESRILNFNKQIQNPLPEEEIRSTVLVTIAKKFR